MTTALHCLRRISNYQSPLYLSLLRTTTSQHGFPDRIFRSSSASPSSKSSNKTADENMSIADKRVLGVIAHINSGKTTTSEAMLYTSGALRRMGNVDVGDTIMDYLPAERERGITITAAAICFNWREHQIFLVDSPGHLDFTFEVERALRVMDGVVVILDAVAGVQPQTETVWRQADANSLPRVIFINKMDRQGADYHRTIADVRHFFGAIPLVTQLPIFDPMSSQFTGVYNLLDRFPSDELTPTFMDQSPSGYPITLTYEQLSDHQKAEANVAVERIVETCADYDDGVMSLWLDGHNVPRTKIVQTIREACVKGLAVPVLCGTSLRGIGVEPLLDSLLTYLPSPLERNKLQAHPASSSKEADTLRSISCDPSSLFLAYAFKITHDKHRGRMVHLRAFSGHLSKRSALLNTTKGKKEQPSRFLRVLADKYEDIECINTGDIFAAVGLKHTETGDTIMLSGISRASQVVLDGVRAPPVVFAIALEVDSSSDEKSLEDALKRLVDEDSSLELRQDDDTGETLLAGMGELHLEVAVDYLQRTLPFQIYKSSPRVSYRECITQSVQHTEEIDNAVGSSRLNASLHLSIRKNKSRKYETEILVEKGAFSSEGEEAVRSGVLAGLGRGPIVGALLTGVVVEVKSVEGSKTQNDSASLIACASKGMHAALKKSGAVLLEPFMRIEATVLDDCIGDIVSELTHPTKRRGIIEDVTADPQLSRKGGDGMSRVLALVPVEGLIGWASKMRSITKGRGDLRMSFAEYREADEKTQTRIVEGTATR